MHACHEYCLHTKSEASSMVIDTMNFHHTLDFLNLNKNYNYFLLLQGLNFTEEMKNVFVIALAVLAIVATTEGLDCVLCPHQPPCVPLYRLGCRGGLTTDQCGCCAVCAKLRNQTCGGLFNEAGKCDCGLKCKRPNVDARGICVPK